MEFMNVNTNEENAEKKLKSKSKKNERRVGYDTCNYS